MGVVADRNECNAHRIGGDFWVGGRVAVSWNQQSASWKIEQRESYSEAIENRHQAYSFCGLIPQCLPGSSGVDLILQGKGFI
jgi:hypothetical protein